MSHICPIMICAKKLTKFSFSGLDPEDLPVDRLYREWTGDRDAKFILLRRTTAIRNV